MKEFIFEQDNRKNWENIKANFKDKFALAYNGAQDFHVTIKPYSPKRSDNQLRAYWALITSVQKYMNDHGNKFSQEQVSYYFKIKSGHCNLGEKIPRSIGNKSDTTKIEMNYLITIILEFGLDNDITDCVIEDKELENMLNFYR